MDERVMFWGALLVSGGGKDCRKEQEKKKKEEEDVQGMEECVVYTSGRKDSRRCHGMEDRGLDGGVVNTEHFPGGKTK